MILLDSNILIDALNNTGGGKAYLLSLDAGAFSVVSYVEVLAGAKTERDIGNARALLSLYERIELSSDIADRTVDVRRDRRLPFADAAIYATAEVHGLRIATRNTRHFKSDDPRVLVPYTLN